MRLFRNLPCRLLVLLLLMGVLGGCDGETTSFATFIPVPAGIGSAEPNLATGPNDTVVLSWLEPIGEGVALKYSVFDADHWSDAKTVAQGTNWFVNWADFPSVVPISENLWAAHWLVKHPIGTYSYDISIAISQDGGKSWNPPITPHTDGTKTEHGFVSLFPWQNSIGAVWLDGRNMNQDANEAQGSPGAGMTLRSAVIAPTGELTAEHLVDELVCDCCQTDIALTATGPVVAYRDRTSAEIRDVYVARHQNHEWQRGRAVADDRWEVSGCPVNGPAIGTERKRESEREREGEGEGDLVGVAWFTSAQGLSRVRVAQSDDGGIAFSPAVDVDTERALGRVDIAMLSDGTMAVSWLRWAAESQGEIVVRLVSKDGTLGPVGVIASTSTSRPAGFPQMVRYGEDLLLAWTHIADGETSVRTARVSLATLR